jgi:hypothetical protein
MADDELVDFGELSKALCAWPDRESGRVFFSIRTGLPGGRPLKFIDSEPARLPVLFKHDQLVRHAFENVALQAGFRGAVVESWVEPKQRPWRRMVEDFLSNAPKDETADESPIGDDLVEIYPVRTALSRFENLGADYVLRFLPPLNQLGPEAAQRLPGAIGAQLTGLNLKRTRRVACLVSATDRSDETEAGFDLVLNNGFWSHELGFTLAGWRQI